MSGLTLITGSNPSINDPSALTINPQRLRDNVGKLKVSLSQNLFEADFEYGSQPLRWETYLAGGGSVTANSAQGGITMNVTSASGDLCIRQTRPYIRYQPGKTIYLASGIQFGATANNQRQRVGFFDDGNGLFFEQADPTATNRSGMHVVYRSDASGIVTDTRTSYENWSDPNNIKDTINWSLIQMIFVEYAWYGAGLLRWGVTIGGEPYILHQIGIANLAGQTLPWARTGNIPVRYELRNVGASSAGSFNHYGVSVLAEGRIDEQRGFTYGYGMAAASPTRNVPTNSVRYPLLSIRYRTMGTLEYGVDAAYSGANGSLPAGGAAIASVVQGASSTTVNLTGTPLVANAWRGKYIFCRGTTAAITSIVPSTGSAVVTTTANPHYLTNGRFLTISGATGNLTVNGTFQISNATGNTFTITGAGITAGAVTGTPVYAYGQGGIGRITANTTSALTVVDNVTGTTPMITPPSAGSNYILGVIDRGQILPQTLNIFSSANCTLELIASTFTSPVALTGASFATMYSLGSLNSFAERDVSATALTGGEVVYNTPLPSGGLQNFNLTDFFPLYNTVQGNMPDILTVAISTPATGTFNIGASIVTQEAMS